MLLAPEDGGLIQHFPVRAAPQDRLPSRRSRDDQQGLLLIGLVRYSHAVHDAFELLGVVPEANGSRAALLVPRQDDLVLNMLKLDRDLGEEVQVDDFDRAVQEADACEMGMAQSALHTITLLHLGRCHDLREVENAWIGVQEAAEVALTKSVDIRAIILADLARVGFLVGDIGTVGLLAHGRGPSFGRPRRATRGSRLFLLWLELRFLPQLLLLLIDDLQDLL